VRNRISGLQKDPGIAAFHAGSNGTTFRKSGTKNHWCDSELPCLFCYNILRSPVQLRTLLRRTDLKDGTSAVGASKRLGISFRNVANLNTLSHLRQLRHFLTTEQDSELRTEHHFEQSFISSEQVLTQLAAGSRETGSFGNRGTESIDFAELCSAGMEFHKDIRNKYSQIFLKEVELSLRSAAKSQSSLEALENKNNPVRISALNAVGLRCCTTAFDAVGLRCCTTAFDAVGLRTAEQSSVGLRSSGGIECRNKSLFEILWKWAKRRHNNRSNRWIFHRYWYKNIFYFETTFSKYYLLDYNLQIKKYGIS
jgi:hypothetical protein